MTTETVGASFIACGRPRSRAGVAEDTGDGLAYAIDVGRAHRGVQGKRHGLAGDALGVGVLAGTPAEPPAERRQVQRLVRYTGADSARLEGVPHLPAVEAQPLEGEQHAPHVPRLAVAGDGARRQQAGRVRGEALEVPLRKRAPRRE